MKTADPLLRLITDRIKRDGAAGADRDQLAAVVASAILRSDVDALRETVEMFEQYASEADAEISGVVAVARAAGREVAGRRSVGEGTHAEAFLAALRRAPTLTGGELASVLGVGPSEVSRTGRTLREAGLVESTRVARSVRWSLTPAGRVGIAFPQLEGGFQFYTPLRADGATEIISVVGSPGSGKSYWIADYARRALDAGVRVWAIDPLGGLAAVFAAAGVPSVEVSGQPDAGGAIDGSSLRIALSSDVSVAEATDVALAGFVLARRAMETGRAGILVVDEVERLLALGRDVVEALTDIVRTHRHSSTALVLSMGTLGGDDDELARAIRGLAGLSGAFVVFRSHPAVLERVAALSGVAVEDLERAGLGIGTFSDVRRERRAAALVRPTDRLVPITHLAV